MRSYLTLFLDNIPPLLILIHSRGGGGGLPPIKNTGRNLSTFTFSHIYRISRRKNCIKYYVGLQRWICRTKVMKNQTFKNHVFQKKSTNIKIWGNTKYISFRAISAEFYQRENNLGSKLATGEPIFRKCRNEKNSVIH